MNKLNIKFHSMPVYDETYIKAKVREFDGVPKGNMHYTCIACITVDSVMRMEKKNYPQIYLEQCKYRIKKMQMSRFRNMKLKSESESESDTESVAKLESATDSE